MNVPFRRTDRSPLLEALARQPPPALCTTRPDARLVPLALGQRTSSGALWWLAALAGITTVNMLLRGASPPATVVAFAASMLLVLLATWRTSSLEAAREAQFERAMHWATRQPFRVLGYDRWLGHARPLFDVHTVEPIDGALFAAAAQRIQRDIQVDVIDERTVRVALPTRTQTTTSKHARTTHTYGDVALLQRVFEHLLVPLHQEHPIEGVTMGG